VSLLAAPIYESPSVQSVRYLARQPILDAHENVFGYELLFRGGAGLLTSSTNSDTASLTTMDYALALGAASLTSGKRAFINCTRELLTDGLVTLLPPDQTVLEILEDVAPDPEVLAACARLRSQGYTLALDDFVPENLGSPFLDLVHFVKVDLRATEQRQWAPVAERLSRRGLKLVAEKVETRAEFRASLNAGYDYFQGYFFCKPTLLQTRDISPFNKNQLDLLRLTSENSLNFKQLEQIIRRDVSLCYRLLRYLNSAAFGLYPVRSIMHALTLLGEREVRKWIALVTTALLAKDRTPELIRMAMIRGKFCESYANTHVETENYFLTGLFSLLEAMLERPMSQLVTELPISDKCRSALLGDENNLTCILRLCTECERAELGPLNSMLPKTDISDVWDRFHSASRWADSVLASAL